MPDEALKEEYKDGARLGQRINLHDLFSVNQYGWYPWVFDQFQLPANAQLLELGCGPGLLWQRNSERILKEWQIILSDFSAGMLAQARRNLQAIRPFNFAGVEAQAIPFPDNSLDAVIANHMLYHVPDRDRAYGEIHRVLKPGGLLYAATNGQFTMRQYDELIARFSPEAPQKHKSGEADIPQDHFYLENGYLELSRWFSPVTERRYEDALVVTAAEPLVAYVESSGYLRGQQLLNLRQHVEEVINTQGALGINKIAGILIATKGSR